MSPEDVLKKYGSQYNFAKKTGMTHQSLGNWLARGEVPPESQFKLERITNGELVSQWSIDHNDGNRTQGV